MTVREFNGTSDRLVTNVGAASGMTYGTWAAIIKFSDLSDYRGISYAHDSAGNFKDAFGTTNFAWYSLNDGVTNSNFDIGGIATGVWYLVVVRKVAGSGVTPRFSVYNFSTSSWLHGNGNAALNAAVAPGVGGTHQFAYQGGSASIFSGRVAARAHWSNLNPWASDSSGDAAIEAAGLHVAASNWTKTAPSTFHLFNQASVATPVTDNSATGSATQASIVGTTAVTGDDPSGFSFTLPSLVLEWGFDEASGDVLDSSGNNRNMTLTTNNVRGAAGSGYTYGGTKPNSKALIQSAAAIQLAFNGTMAPFNTTARTVMFWGKLPGANPSWAMEYYNAGSDTGVFGWLLLSGSWRFRAKDSFNNVYERVLTAAPTVYHHYCATHDGTNLKVYVDGVQVGANVAMAVPVWNADAIRVFDQNGTTGGIDDVRIFNTALTSTEINTWKDTPIGGAAAASTKVYFSNGSQASGIYEMTTGGVLVQRNSIIVK